MILNIFVIILFIITSPLLTLLALLLVLLLLLFVIILVSLVDSDIITALLSSFFADALDLFFRIGFFLNTFTQDLPKRIIQKYLSKLLSLLFVQASTNSMC